MNRLLTVLIVLVGLVWLGFSFMTFTVDETQKAILFQFGEIVRIVEEPGLYLKTPFVQNVAYLDDRLLSVDIQPAQIITIDRQRVTVDSYTVWRIQDSQKFVETLRTRSNAEQRLDDIVYSHLRDVLGQKNFNEVLQRDFLADVKQRTQNQVQEFGIAIIDVRIKRADLPEANEQAVYERMISERRQIAQRYRAEGEQEAQKIRSEADRQVTIIKADANKTSEELKGEGDAQALEIYADAYNQDTDFFLFWRTLESFKKSLATNTTLVLSSESEYLKLLSVMKAQALSQGR